MCFSMPAKVIKIIDQDWMQVVQNKEVREVKSTLLGNIKKNDWVLINADLAVSKITAEEAKLINNYYKKND